jgi:tetratricopeptide (TPR) repeat protein
MKKKEEKRKKNSSKKNPLSWIFQQSASAGSATAYRTLGHSRSDRRSQYQRAVRQAQGRMSARSLRLLKPFLSCSYFYDKLSAIKLFFGGITMADEQNTNAKAASALADALQTAGQKISQAIDDLKDVAPVLSNTDKRRLANMGDGNLPFTDKAVELAEKYSDLLPKYIKLEDFESDMEIVHASWSLITQTKELGDLLNDSRIKYGADGYEKARAFYKEAQAAEKLGVPGAAEVIKELKSRYKGQGKQAEKSADDGAQTEDPAAPPEGETRSIG